MNQTNHTIIKNPVKGRDIVVISLSHWDTTIGSNARNISQRFAKDNRVLYINYPITRKTFINNDPKAETAKHIDIIKNKKEPLEQLQPNLWVYYPTTLVESVKWIPFTPLFRLANAVNSRRYARDMKKAIRLLGFKDIILFNDMDIYNGFRLKELLKPSIYIYYFKDFLQGFAYWKRHAVTMEPILIKKADAIVCNSTFYNEYCLGLTDKSYYIGQGCDLRLFQPDKQRPKPADMQQIPGPIIGYVGVLDKERLNEEILLGMAENLPEWNIVLVGPSDETFKASRLHSFKNVHFLGWKDITSLPEYIQAFDVCMNPQLINNITRGNYPLKIDEYLAMGKPVVATRTKAMKFFEHYTYLADTPEEYPALIKKALAENTTEKEKERIEFATSHTWENSVSEIYRAMHLYFKD